MCVLPKNPCMSTGSHHPCNEPAAHVSTDYHLFLRSGSPQLSLGGMLKGPWVDAAAPPRLVIRSTRQ